MIANRGELVVRLVSAGKAPVGTAGKGGARAVRDWLESHPLPDYARRSAAEIDAAIGDEREPWG